uniref:hypothetical protein n=1 Tax=Pseudomonas syringae TaxID=317 RepID=UPI001E2C9656|nr:hypothetical protein [Pseudomonas syringae]QOQ33547.1 hypothetical protein [Pseudomonas syringae pv. actinidiae]
MTNTNSPAALIEAADNELDELDELRRDAERYRVLRQQWLRIEDGATVHRAKGLDLLCDKLNAAAQRPANSFDTDTK